MSKILCVTLLGFMSSSLSARTVKTETVQEEQKTENKVFCSKSSEKEAQALCEKWLAQQSKTLGERLLTSFCGQGEQSTDADCLYKASGELRYVLKKHKTETDRSD